MLNIKDLHAIAEDKKILSSINLKINSGEVHVVMGPNGSGKSTLAQVIAGNPKYKITKGLIKFLKKDITGEDPSKRAQDGIFLSFQNPVEIEGVSVLDALLLSYNSIKLSKNEDTLDKQDFLKILKQKMKILSIPEDFIYRAINVNFSGGEKKKLELLQAMLLNPKFIIFDEIDSGVDIDSLKIIAKNIKKLKNGNNAILLITHYQKILEYIKPDFVHIMIKGRIKKSGDKSLIKKIEKSGYSSVV